MYNYGKTVKNPDKSVYTTSATHAQTAVLKKKKQYKRLCHSESGKAF